MAVSFRLPFILSTWLTSGLVITALASPIQPLYPRGDLVKASNGTYAVFNSLGQVVGQGSSSDGSGHDFSPPAIIWLVFSLVVGIPLALGGLRLWRLTTGASLGIVATACVWAAFVNTVNSSGISDLVLTCIVMGAFVVGFILGVFDFGRKIGIFMLGMSGGFSIGVRIALFRPGLLIPVYGVNWLFPILFAAAGFVLAVAKQRAGIVIGSASAGTFLTALGIDLIINRQNGMSFGLRFLFDRNDVHLVEFTSEGYHPPISTIIIMAVSLALIPILSYGQHRIFPQPFKRLRPESVLSTISDTHDGEVPDVVVEAVETTPMAPQEKDPAPRNSEDPSLAKSTDKLVSVKVTSS